jgi:hypothetical protein
MELYENQEYTAAFNQWLFAAEAGKQLHQITVVNSFGWMPNDDNGWILCCVAIIGHADSQHDTADCYRLGHGVTQVNCYESFLLLVTLLYFVVTLLGATQMNGFGLI